MKPRLFLLLPLLFLVATCSAQSADPALLAEINKIQAVDNHTHVPKLVGPDEKDDEYDALPCSGYLEPSDDPAVARPNNPGFMEAWQKIYRFPYHDRSEAHMKFLLASKNRMKRSQGDHYPTWVLDQLGIEYMLANRIAMGRGLDPKRFLWVPFDDALMLPFDAAAMAETPDKKFFYSREARLISRYMKDAGVSALPATLDDYVAKVVTPTLESQKKAGAVAIKFEAAYLRALNFEAPQEEARTIYTQYVAGGAPTRAEYTKLSDWLFRAIAREAGRLGLAVHIHTGSGCGGYFNISGSNPALLDSALNDPSLRKTNFVLVHGGAGPFTKEAAFQLSKPNVYVDFSEQVWMQSERTVAQVLRYWLEAYPEKVLFGTDLFPGTAEIDWEEIGYMCTRSGRHALAIALTGMMQDGEITRERALELARMALRGNAIKLYSLK